MGRSVRLPNGEVVDFHCGESRGRGLRAQEGWVSFQKMKTSSWSSREGGVDMNGWKMARASATSRYSPRKSSW